MNKVGIVNSGEFFGIKPKYVIVGDSITQEQHIEAAKQMGCEINEIVFMTPDEYKSYCQLTQPTYVLSNPRASLEEMERMLPKDYTYMETTKESQTPWYNKFDKKRKRK